MLGQSKKTDWSRTKAGVVILRARLDGASVFGAAVREVNPPMAEAVLDALTAWAADLTEASSRECSEPAAEAALPALDTAVPTTSPGCDGRRTVAND
jgi:hypothetical protein